MSLKQINNVRETLFISHATPEDNPFAEWLYAKLTLAGYKCWIDTEGLSGGERDFSEEIQRVIRDETCKFLLVFSGHTFTKEFVKDEYEYARSIATQQTINDFIFPLRIADVSFNERIGLNRYNHFHFFPSWPSGLSDLLQKLKKDNVPCHPNKSSELIEAWLKNKYTRDSGINSVKRTYYSNWWRLGTLPENLHIFQYSNEDQAQAIVKEETRFPKIQQGNIIVAFQGEMPNNISIQEENIEINPSKRYRIPISDIINGFDGQDFPTHKDAQNLLKTLLRKALKNHLFNVGLSRYKLSGIQECFYYNLAQQRGVKVQASYPNHKTRRTLFGKFGSNSWHFGISFKVLLEPVISYSLKSHIIFTENGYKAWEDKDKMHTARRKKGRMMFNKEWRDLLVTMIQSLKNDEGRITLQLTEDFQTEMEPLPIRFDAGFDYVEPRKTDRLDILVEESELTNEEEKELEDEQDEPQIDE